MTAVLFGETIATDHDGTASVEELRAQLAAVEARRAAITMRFAIGYMPDTVSDYPARSEQATKDSSVNREIGRQGVRGFQAA